MSRPNAYEAGGADVLRCTVCGHEEPLGDMEERQRKGWPKHCGETMFVAVSRQRPPIYDPRNP